MPDTIDSDNINLLHDEFFVRLKESLDGFFPLREKTISLKRLKSPWLSRPMLRCIEKKHRMYRLFKSGIINRPYFNSYKNKLRKLLVLAKKHYFANRFAEARNNIKKTWKIINDSLNRSSSKTTTINNLTTNEGLIVRDQVSIGNVLNNHFINAVVNDEFSNSSNNEMIELVQPRADSAIFLETFPLEVVSITNSLKNNNNIHFPTKFLKLCVPVVSSTIAALFNACLDTGIYPDCLKTANITPIFKKGDKSDLGNYRPISVLSDLNKIYEELLYVRLINYLDDKNILTDSQYGFRKHRSTQEVCIDMISSLLSAYTKKQYSLCLFIDFRKAFDSIDHARLILKLEHYGIRGNALFLFASYLTNRKQRVLLNGEFSDWLTIQTGVPQGSKLAPILFNLFVNDLANLPFQVLSPFQYADDTSFTSSNACLERLVQAFNTDLCLFFQWCTANKLMINFSKTKAMLLTPKKLPNNIPQVLINNVRIDYVAEYSYLGIIIDNKLSFRSQIHNLNVRLSRIAGASYATKNHFSLEAAKIFYNSMALSLITYLIPVWGGASNTLISDLQITQNKIVRNLFGNKINWTHTTDIFRALKILKITSVYKLELGKLVYNILYMNRYSKLAASLSELSWTHNYNTRKINIYQLPFARVQVDRASTLFSAVNLWNGLPLSVRSCKSLYSFASNLKKYLLETQN